ncbi:nicotinamide riboside transporter PnuC [Lactococcus garvieae]
MEKNLEVLGNSDGEVIPRKISKSKALIMLVSFIVIYGIVLLTSHHFNGQQIFLDATLLPLGIISMILMTYGYRTQWIGWILIDSINVIIWYNNWASSTYGGASAIGMLVLQITMLINCIYGASIWFRKNLNSAVILLGEGFVKYLT